MHHAHGLGPFYIASSCRPSRPTSSQCCPSACQLWYRAKNIRNRPEVNQKISKTLMIKDQASEIEKLKIDLMAAREKNGVYIPTDRYEAVS